MFADSIDYLDSRHWDQLTSTASAFLSRRYLMALESACPDELTLRYAIIYRDRKPIAALVAQIVRVSGDRVAGAMTPRKTAGTKLGKVIRAARQKLRAAAVRRMTTRVIVCGNLLSWGQHGVAFADEVDVAEIWPGVAEALYRLRRAERLTGQTDFVLVKDIPQGELVPSQSLMPFSYRSFETDPDMVLEFPNKWKSFDDYLASLSKKYRKTATQIIAEVSAGGYTVERLDDIASEGTRLFELYCQVHERAAVRPMTLSPDYFAALSAAFGDDFRCTVIRKGEELVGFVTVLRDGETAVGYYIGFDSEVNAQVPLYFRLLYSLVEESIAMGCRRVSLGRTALEPKARLGAKPQPLYLWVRHRVQVANWILRGLLNAVPHDDVPERSPFKDVTEGKT